jgi:hypothetical protein
VQQVPFTLAATRGHVSESKALYAELLMFPHVTFPRPGAYTVRSKFSYAIYVPVPQISLDFQCPR